MKIHTGTALTEINAYCMTLLEWHLNVRDWPQKNRIADM